MENKYKELIYNLIVKINFLIQFNFRQYKKF